MQVFLSIIICLLFLPSVVLSQNTTITSFSKSKKQLVKIYQDNPTKQEKINQINQELEKISLQVEDALYQNKDQLLSKLTSLQGKLLDERTRIERSL